jgi:hypothetical protein
MHRKDAAGLDNAYKSPDSVFISGDTMYIAGTHNPQDILDDMMLPIGFTTSTGRYRAARSHLTKQIRYVVGHSLGGAVANQLVANHNWLHGRIYSAPIRSRSGASTAPHSRVQSFKHPYDPIAMFDQGAEQSSFTPDIHGYRGYD